MTARTDQAVARQSELIEWAAHLAPSGRRFVVAHGEPRAFQGLRSALRTRLSINAECPKRGAVIALD